MEDKVSDTAQNPFFDLRQFVQPLAFSLCEKPRITYSGPRNWWKGPLDVEGLALGAVDCFARTLATFLPKNQRNQIRIDSSRVAASFNSLSSLRVNGKPTLGFAELSGFFPVKDGWVRLHANYPHHKKVIQRVLGESELEGIQHTLQQISANEVEHLVNSAGGIASSVRSLDEWNRSDNARFLRKEPWIKFSLERDTKPNLQPLTPSITRPLKGIRILDLTRVIAGPSATRLLAALGADVLRIDPPFLPELRDQHLDTGFDKRSAIADLADKKTSEQVHLLLSQADAVFLGYRLSGLCKLGFDPEALRDRHPHLAVVSLDAWGQSAPKTLARGFDSIVQAGTGIAHIYGSFKDGIWRPGALPVQALDHATGLGMAAAALALIAARKDGISGSAHLSLARTAIELLSQQNSPDSTAELPKVSLRSMNSDYGLLEFSPPPITTTTADLEYQKPPVTYGTSNLEWAD